MGAVVKMRDFDIRRKLRRELRRRFEDDPDTVVVEELGILQGKARVDIAVVNGLFHGYEIKSACDTMHRLPQQARLYDEVFDCVSLVVSERHLQHALELVPEWWEIILAIPEPSGEIAFQVLRTGRANPYVNARAIAELLWREDAILMLSERGAARGYLSKPRRLIWDRLCEVYNLDEIKEAVRLRLKCRAVLNQRAARPTVASPM